MIEAQQSIVRLLVHLVVGSVDVETVVPVQLCNMTGIVKTADQ